MHGEQVDSNSENGVVVTRRAVLKAQVSSSNALTDYSYVDILALQYKFVNF